MKILSVDDSKTVRQVIQNMASVIAAEFLEAENGVEALKVLESCKGQVDLIILDWEMPEMDGREFLTIIKKDERYCSIPVIMLTTVSQKDKVIDAVRAGAKQYITKPFSGEDLLTKIVHALGIDSIDDL